MRSKFWTFFALVGSPLTVVFFQNCSGSLFGGAEMSTYSSALPASFALSGACADQFRALYATTYFPLLSNQCVACHTNGPGIGKFGSGDFETSVQAFFSMGRSAIDHNAVNAGHHPPYTGAVNAAAISSFQSPWAILESGASCKSTAPTQNETSLTTIGKANDKILANAVAKPNNTAFLRIEWDLDTEVTGHVNKIHLVAGIDVRVTTLNGVQRGYEFRNPTLRLKSAATKPVTVKGLSLTYNGIRDGEVTTYEFFNQTIGTVTDVNLSPGTANAFLDSVSILKTDTFGLTFSGFFDAAGNDLLSPGSNGN